MSLTRQTQAVNELSTSEKAFIAIQHILPQHLLSRLAGLLADTQTPAIKNFLIRQFIQHFDVDMSEAIIEDPAQYPSFNHFFTRPLKPGARLIDSSNDSIVSPADGCISQMGRIQQQTLIQAKGREYNLDALLAGDAALANTFRNGEFMTIYLSPRDYHRVHMPCDGKLLKAIYVPGKLFSVNDATAQGVDKLFARNERLICVFDTPAGKVTMILVGAMIVAGIQTVWHDFREARYGRRPGQFEYSPVSIKKGDEMGRFKLGSTVILLFENGRINWREGKANGDTTQMGSNIAYLKNDSV